jgi:hypothetical protein
MMQIHFPTRLTRSFYQFKQPSLQFFALATMFQTQSRGSAGKSPARWSRTVPAGQSVRTMPKCRLHQKIISGLYHLNFITTTRNRVPSVLDERAQTFQEFEVNNTVLTTFTDDNFIKQDNLQDIISLVTNSVTACISEQCNIDLHWPFSVLNKITL